MKTVSINICNLCIPCQCHCKYCLLSWKGSTSGVPYLRSEDYARRIYEEIKRDKKDLGFSFYCGYSMEHPNIEQMLAFARETGSSAASFLQLNGMKMRDDRELGAYLKNLHNQGIRVIDLTFYGMGESHDRFAGRKGDFDYLLRIMKAANGAEIAVTADVALTSQNAPEMGELLSVLKTLSPEKISLFVPHSEGRGRVLEPVRFSKAAFDSLDGEIQNMLNPRVFKTEAQWLSDGDFQPYEKRVVTVVLDQDNISFFEEKSLEEAISYVEQLDDDYYSHFPSLQELAARYGDPENTLFYRRRDLEMKYEKRFMEDHHLSLYDIHDETHCFVRRFR